MKHESDSGIEERRVDELVRNIKRIDRMLENSVRTLINFIQRAIDDPRKMPLFVSSDAQPIEERMYRITHAITCSTLLRIDVLRRRFGFLKRDGNGDDLDRVVKAIPSRFETPLRAFETDEEIFDFLDKHLSSSTFGALNPLTASWVFWTLMYAGESYAHSGLGFLSFFAMLWALERGRPHTGAGLDPWRPTAYITSRCLFPIEMMIGTCKRRADRFDKMKKLIDELNKLADEKTERGCWTFALKLDLFSTVLHETARIAIDPEAFIQCATEVTRLTGELRSGDEIGTCWREVKKSIVKMLNALGERNREVIGSASNVVDKFLPRFIEILSDKNRRESLIERHCRQFRYGVTEAEWAKRISAAKDAHKMCEYALRAYRQAMETCTDIPLDAEADCINISVKAVIAANREVKEKFESEISPALDWCKRVVNEESSRASAGSDSEFDATELVHATAICARAARMTSSEVRDAVVKALHGRQGDGSWSPGKPFYIQNRVLGAWSTTSETIWTLASALVSHPEITEADDALIAFVEWLEKTQQPVFDHNKRTRIIGWSSERFRQPETVDTWATCNGVNALLPIRTLLEYRLWEICERNFTVVDEFRDIETVDPGDLLLPHKERLHRSLLQTAWRAERLDKQAQYAFILHGPPGTSKTTVAGTLAQQLWQTTQFAKRPEPAGATQARLVRITPADFMHGGEENIDARARVIFKLLSHIRAATIFFDEIDDFLRRRDFKDQPTFIKLVAPAMLNRLQDLRDAAPMQEICFVLGTNFIDKMDPALIRPGRIDRAIPMVFPDLPSKKAIAQKLKVPHHFIDIVSKGTLFWPFQTYTALCETLKLDENKSLKPDEIEKLMASFRAEADRAQRFYQDSDRWERADDRFQEEFRRIVFSHGDAEALSFCSALQKVVTVSRDYPSAAVSLIQQNLSPGMRATIALADAKIPIGAALKSAKPRRRSPPKA
jgi:hypothetical protein